MDIKEFGGEFKLIEHLVKKPKHTNLIESIGDDCAVLNFSEDEYMLVTKDMIVENDHFSREYFSPYEIGLKLVESNVSDIAAMGGYPVYGFVGMSLTRDVEVGFMESLYKGINDRCDEYKFDIVGGDTTHGSLLIFSLSLIGRVSKKLLTLRKTAKKGDIIKVTGSLGASTAGYRLYKKKQLGHEYVKHRHRNPKCRIDIAKDIAKYATSMIDVSDGLSGDLGHILQLSNVGAILDKNLIPIEKETIEVAQYLGEDPFDYALYGGEDFELLYTVNREHKDKVFGIELGEIIEEQKTFLRDDGTMIEIENKGFNHFD